MDKQGSANAAAQYVLGVTYANGQGVIQDFQQAVDWYRKSAEQRN
jgi:TPR repeat protein